jgi:sporulation protein YlmC with PRC-barrel domain
VSLSVADLHVGSAVYSKEGEKVGRLRFMMVDPGEQSVSHLVLEKGMLLHADVLAPVLSVERILYRGIFLNISSEDVLNLPEFQEGRYLARERHNHSNGGDRGDRENRENRGDHHVPRHHGGHGNHDGGSGGGHRRSRRFRRH